MTLALIAIVVFGSMLVEAGRAARNEREQRARGGVEPRDDVYGVMRVVYPAAFMAMLAEGWLRGAAGGEWLAWGAAMFAGAKIVKGWAILTLGRAWTFRVIVVPDDPLVRTGPYRYIRHPNYVGVVGELVGVAMLTRAFATGPVVLLGFGVLLWRRVAAEERALKI